MNDQQWNSSENVAEWKHLGEGDITIPTSKVHTFTIPTITKREEILQAAVQCVTKDRQATHGKPENSFADIAYLWSWYKGVEFTPQETAVMMALMKMARIKGNHLNDDNFIDLSGYCALAAELKPQSP